MVIVFDAVVVHAVSTTSGHILPQLLQLGWAQASWRRHGLSGQSGLAWGGPGQGEQALALHVEQVLLLLELLHLQELLLEDKLLGGQLLLLLLLLFSLFPRMLLLEELQMKLLLLFLIELLQVLLLEHHRLLLLEQGLELLRGEHLLLKNLLHLLWCDHLGTHHGHRHWNLQWTLLVLALWRFQATAWLLQE